MTNQIADPNIDLTRLLIPNEPALRLEISSYPPSAANDHKRSFDILAVAGILPATIELEDKDGDPYVVNVATLRIFQKGFLNATQGGGFHHPQVLEGPYRMSVAGLIDPSTESMADTANQLVYNPANTILTLSGRVAIDGFREALSDMRNKPGAEPSHRLSLMTERALQGGVELVAAS